MKLLQNHDSHSNDNSLAKKMSKASADQVSVQTELTADDAPFTVLVQSSHHPAGLAGVGIYCVNHIFHTVSVVSYLRSTQEIPASRFENYALPQIMLMVHVD